MVSQKKFSGFLGTRYFDFEITYLRELKQVRLVSREVTVNSPNPTPFYQRQTTEVITINDHPKPRTLYNDLLIYSKELFQ